MTQNLQGDPEAFKKIGNAHPWGGGEFGDVDDVRWITGVSLAVDGGFLCQ